MSDQPEGVVDDLVKELAEKAHDLDAVRKSVEDAASLSGTLWLSYLFALFYIGIAAGAVTHKDLLLENAVKLPFLNVELPVVAFFALAPILFVISHAYTLMHFVLLAAKVGTFNAELRKKIPDPNPNAAPTEDISSGRAAELRETRLGLRRQLPSNIFVQFLAGPRDIRDGGLGWCLKAVAWISLVIGPALLLLLLQIQFLPYHLEWVTWVQRFAVLADVTLLWFLWPAVLASRGAIQWPRPWQFPALALLSLIPLGFAFTAATFPGEWLDEHVGKKQWIPPNRVTARLGLRQKDEDGTPILTSFHNLLFYGEKDVINRRRTSVFSNTLVLPRFEAWGEAKIDDPKGSKTAQQTLSLWRRNLDEAILDGADLRKVDLVRASLQRASLIGAKLQGASLGNAKLQGASLDDAQLQGASLGKAQLQGTSLLGTQLQGASLSQARLQGALLERAQFQGADLERAQLQGAALDNATLQGALLKGAQLQGASLKGAYLQGTDFQKSTLVGTTVGEAKVWRTSFADSTVTNVFEDGLEESAISKEEFAIVKSTIMKEVPEGQNREGALKRIEILNPDIFGPDASEQGALEKGRVDETAYKESLANELKSLACSGREDARYIVRGLIANARIFDTGDSSQKLIDTIFCRQCPVSDALTEADEKQLEHNAVQYFDLDVKGDD